MTIGFSHCQGYFTNNGFHEARMLLAASIGLELNSMQGFGGTVSWPSAKTQPLVHLLNHADCEGSLSPAQCTAVAQALRAAVEPWPQEQSYRGLFLEMACGMERCAKNNEPFLFL